MVQFFEGFFCLDRDVITSGGGRGEDSTISERSSSFGDKIPLTTFSRKESNFDCASNKVNASAGINASKRSCFSFPEPSSSSSYQSRSFPYLPLPPYIIMHHSF